MKTLLALFPLLVAPALAQNPRQEKNTSGGVLHAEQAAYDVLHYDLLLTVVPEKKQIAGALTMKARIVAETEALLLHLDDRLKVFGVASGKDKLLFTHEEGALRIVLPKAQRVVGGEVSIQILYSGEPRVAPRPPWDGGFTWKETAAGEPWIATTCQGEGADLWWPCKDHPSDKPDSMDLHITVPANLVVASNGKLLSVAESTRAGRSFRTYNWHVSTPIANYTVALNIAPYETLSETYKSVSGDDIAVTYWVLPENVEKGKGLMQEILKHLAVFEELLGPYPFRADKYGVAETPHLGMEHQTIIAYGHNYQGARYTDYDYDWLHNHEFAHEWWANLVTCRDWKDFWIHEGIGTYMQALYLEKAFGAQAYHDKMAVDRRGIVNRGPVAPRVARSTQQMYFSQEGPAAPGIDVYMKGAWICHVLRGYMGDEKFFEVLRRWAYPDPAMEAITDGGQVRFSDTEEIRAIAEQHSGLELGWFFDVYLRQAALPKLKSEVKDDALHLRWEVPNDLPFHLPVPVRVGDEVVRVEMTDGAGVVALAGREYVIDPDHWLLKEEPRRR